MNNFLTQQFYSNSIQDWLISFGILIASLIIAKTLYWVFRKFIKGIAEKTKTSLDDILIDQLEEPVVYGVVMIGLYWGVHRLEFGNQGRCIF